MEILPNDVLAAMHAATDRETRRRSRLRIEVAETSYRVLRRWRGGFALDAGQIGHLRGRVGLFEGIQHLSECLIVASELADGELICTIKSETPVSRGPAQDYERDETTIAGYLTHA